MEKVSLILEGGGMRGLYTAGVLDAFLDHGIRIPDCIGVSAGACNGASYLPGQRTRFYTATTRFMRDSRYFSFANLWKYGSFFGTDFMFDDVANYLEPIDYAGYARCGGRLTAVVTNCVTGKAEYHLIHNLWKQRDLIRASASLPLVSPIVTYEGTPYLDGGIAAPIPLRYAVWRGFSKHVLILTRPAQYRKQPTAMMSVLRMKYRRYPKLLQALAMRHIAYNRTLEEIARMEAEGKVFVIRPAHPVKIARFERDPDRAARLYNMGIRDAVQALPALRRFLGGASLLPSASEGGSLK